MVPAWQDGRWKPAVATPLEYFRRFELHNRLFQDDVRLEGALQWATGVAWRKRLEVRVNELLL